MTDNPSQRATEDTMTKDQFCERFTAQMTKYLQRFDCDHDELVKYAKAVAPSYWDEPHQREDGPEVCADTDVSYWEE